MSVSTVGVVEESADGEHRVAMSPDGVTRLRAAGLEVLVQEAAGRSAWFPDDAYAEAGARLVSKQDLYGLADLVVCVQPPGKDDRALLRPGQLLVGLLQPLINPGLARSLAAAKVTAISLDGLPRTVSRAQSMDALSSQANVAGYKAALLAAGTYSNYLPMFMTAAGTTRPALVLVIGAGVAGLQAIGTARRLGAVVTGYDVRDAARSEVLSLGATFLDLGLAVSATGEGGYARALTEQERDAQQAALNAAIGKFDIVITTAQVPGRRPPLLVSATALAAMRAGSVVVDLGSSELGGNVEGSVAGTNVVTANGVTVIGASNLPSAVPKASSTAYSRNMCALLAHLIHDGEFTVDPADEITAGVLVTHDGEVVHPGVSALLTDAAGDSTTSTAAATSPAATAGATSTAGTAGHRMTEEGQRG
jgi:NAD(P) transhydrogenase subunit alpha